MTAFVGVRVPHWTKSAATKKNNNRTDLSSSTSHLKCTITRKPLIGKQIYFPPFFSTIKKAIFSLKFGQNTLTLMNFLKLFLVTLFNQSTMCSDENRLKKLKNDIYAVHIFLNTNYHCNINKIHQIAFTRTDHFSAKQYLSLFIEYKYCGGRMTLV